ncbi:hypothetical protein [Calothrix sp. CCY 0018]|uniref:hypothetical protein n=1 Tax=Calothrix sp. CCY 0018 TaxID=3103864 RepID=UPI0039C6B075
MSTTPKSNYKLEGNKIVVFLTLNFPLEFEIELEGTQYPKILESAISANSDIIINEIKKTQLDEKIQVLSNKLATEILDKSNSEEKLNSLMAQDILNTSLDNTNEPQSNLQVTSTPKKTKVRFPDSVNDSLTLAVNIVGNILFLGKLANYSWE